MKRAARGSLKYKKWPKIRHLGTIAQLCPAISSQLRHISTIGKKLLNNNTSSTCVQNMANFSLLAAEIVSLVWGHPSKLQRVSHLCSVTARHSSSGRQPDFAALKRGRHLYSAGRPSRWAVTHISSLSYLEADFEVFRPTGATCCTMGVKFGTEEGLRSPSPCQITPHRCNDKGIGPQKN